MDRIKVLASPDKLTEVIVFAENNLKESGAELKDIAKTLLLLEECFVSLCQAAEENSHVSIGISRGKILLQAKGEKIQLKAPEELCSGLAESEIDELAEARIRSMILKANEDILSASYRNGVNSIRINVKSPSASGIKKVAFAFLLAIAVGMLLKFIPGEITETINHFIFSPVKTLFLNALKMLIAPLVFFSIASSVGSFTDLKQLGRVSGKIVLFYTFTTIMAVVLGILSFNVVSPGTIGMFAAENTAAAEAVERVDFLSVLTGIVPDNFFGSFVKSDMLQLIFLAIFFGLATATLGSNSSKVSEFLNAGSDLFMKGAEYITGCMPLIIFVSITSLIINSEVETIVRVIAVTIQIVATLFLMQAVYGILIFFIGKKNPFSFYRSVFPACINAFALSSSNAAMSYTMETCDKKLGIPKSIYSFSIPLGATINMDGLSIILTICTLFFAKAYGNPLTAADLASLIFTVAVLSCGTPGVPGASVLCCSILFQQFGIPLEAVTIYIAMDAILDPLSTANNICGDIVGTYIVAAREGVLKKVRGNS